MATNFSDVIKKGYVKLKSKKLGVWNRRWIVLCTSSSRGGPRIQKYTDEQSYNDNLECKAICLKHVVFITKLPKFTVSIHFNDGSSQAIACETGEDQYEWDNALHLVCLEKDTNSNHLTDTPTTVKVKPTTDSYHVFLLPSHNLSVQGECIMQINAETIQLLDVHNPQICLVKWPLNALRRYGRDEAKFTFESGRFCDTGEGIFIFHTINGEEIYQKVHSATLAIAEAHRVVQRQQNARMPVTASKSVPLSPHLPKPEPPGRQISTRSLPATPGDSPAFNAPTLPSSLSTRKLPPVPPPRRASDSETTRHNSLTGEDRRVSNSVFLHLRNVDLEGESSTSIYNGNEDEPEPIYEEKYLDPKFRRFLESRKQDL